MLLYKANRSIPSSPRLSHYFYLSSFLSTSFFIIHFPEYFHDYPIFFQMFIKFASTPRTIFFICLLFVGNSINGDLTLFFYIFHSCFNSQYPYYSHQFTQVDLAKINNDLLIYKSGNTSHNLAHLILRN